MSIAAFRAELGDIHQEDNPRIVQQRSRDHYWYSPVPLDAASDTVTAAAAAVTQFTTALPLAQIVFVQREAGLVIDTGRDSLLTEAAKKAYDTIIAPLHTEEQTLTIGQMRKSVHKAFAAIGRNPLDFMDCEPRVLGAAAAVKASDALQDEVTGQDILALFELYLGNVEEEAARVLGFRTGTSAAEAQTEAAGRASAPS